MWFRARLLEGLLPFLPSNVETHFSSRVCKVENVAATDVQKEHVRLTIETPSSDDGQSAHQVFEVSAVIGCDGIRSTVRTSCMAFLAASDSAPDTGVHQTDIRRLCQV
jgi:2-polyprenyl-6-methoxyphenol hydroxylase-like FAD-dependent oxidoreductase